MPKATLYAFVSDITKTTITKELAIPASGDPDKYFRQALNADPNAEIYLTDFRIGAFNPQDQMFTGWNDLDSYDQDYHKRLKQLQHASQVIDYFNITSIVDLYKCYLNNCNNTATLALDELQPYRSYEDLDRVFEGRQPHEILNNAEVIYESDDYLGVEPTTHEVMSYTKKDAFNYICDNALAMFDELNYLK